MAILAPNKRQNVLSGFITAQHTFRFRGDYALNTVYDAYDVVIDPVEKVKPVPNYVLRYTTKAHTSPATGTPASAFQTGTEQSTNGSPAGVQWMRAPLNGRFRGPFALAANPQPSSSFSPQAIGGDICIHPTNGNLIRALYQSSFAPPLGQPAGTIDETKWTTEGVFPFFHPVTSGMLVQPDGAPHADFAGIGLWQRRSILRYLGRKITVFNSPADFTSITGPAATQETADPVHPNGSVVLHFGNVATVNLATPTDMSGIVRMAIRAVGSGATRTGITHGYFEMTSDPSHSFTNCKQFEFITSQDSRIADDAWDWAAAGPGYWKTIGALDGLPGATNLNAITAYRFNLIGSSATTLKVGFVETVQANTDKGWVVLTFDDSNESDWTLGIGWAAKYGFPLTMVASGMIDQASSNPSTLTPNQSRYMTEFFGAQMAIHFYNPNDGADPQLQQSPGFDQWLMQGRGYHNGVGSMGSDDGAWHDNTHLTQYNIFATRALYRAVRGYDQAEPQNELLPPGNKWKLRCLGVSQTDTQWVAGTLHTAINRGDNITQLDIDNFVNTSDIYAGETLVLWNTTAWNGTSGGNGTGTLTNGSAVIPDFKAAKDLNGVTYPLPVAGTLAGAPGIPSDTYVQSIVINGAGPTYTVTLTKPVVGMATSPNAAQTISLIALDRFQVVNDVPANPTPVAGLTSIAVTPRSAQSPWVLGVSVFAPGQQFCGRVDRAATYRTMAILAWDPSVTYAEEDQYKNLMIYLDRKRSVVNVGTLADALRPWTVAP